MSGNNDISVKLDMAITACKTIYRVCSSIVSSQTNISLDINKRFDNIEKQLAELKEEIQKTDKLLTGDYHIYSDFELYNIKQSMSWKKLSQKTNIPLSTLQYRVRRYLKQNGGENNAKL